MAHTMYFDHDNGVEFTETWTAQQIQWMIKSMIRKRGYKPYKFAVKTYNHDNRATRVEVISSKSGKVSDCYISFAFGRYVCEPNNQQVFVA